MLSQGRQLRCRKADDYASTYTSEHKVYLFLTFQKAHVVPREPKAARSIECCYLQISTVFTPL